MVFIKHDESCELYFSLTVVRHRRWCWRWLTNKTKSCSQHRTGLCWFDAIKQVIYQLKDTLQPTRHSYKTKQQQQVVGRAFSKLWGKKYQIYMWISGLHPVCPNKSESHFARKTASVPAAEPGCSCSWMDVIMWCDLEQNTWTHQVFVTFQDASWVKRPVVPW